MTDTSNLAGGEFHAPVLLSLGEDPRVEHRRVGGLGAVLPAEHPERQLGVVHHGRDYELGSAQPIPVGPGPVDPDLPAQRAADGLRRRQRGRVGEGAAVEGSAEALVRVLLGLELRRRGIGGHGRDRV